ncbi:NlpC/P60 family protein [Devosia sp. ZB163]|uniref:NlpC/P60 family protein n=1 Tax=Devosia sp. ZB163 TaxID=3025938 RepID=UPI002360E700|nr:NlpC/P60 family protein [Devosia sp. ZB163]MDC9823831.1 NlpC/P60 family protein [Devosia sp. ZB163]
MSAQIVAAARAWVGTPYRHRAATLGAGCDCLGLLVGVWRAVYGTEPPELPNYRADWRDASHAAELEALAGQWLAPGAMGPGAVLLFRMGAAALPRHCGIMVGEGRFVHAQERLGVVEGNLTDGWRKRVARVLAFPTLG